MRHLCAQQAKKETAPLKFFSNFSPRFLGRNLLVQKEGGLEGSSFEETVEEDAEERLGLAD
jgi:hypothetical protein